MLERWRAPGWPEARHLAWFIEGDQLQHWLTWENRERPSKTDNWTAVRSWLDQAATRRQLEAAARASAPRDMTREAVLGLEALVRGRADLKFDGGIWIPDRRSPLRARDLGVELPELPAG